MLCNAIQICVALRKRQLQFYTVTEDRFIHLRDVHLPEPAVELVCKTRFIFYALYYRFIFSNDIIKFS